MFCAPRLVFGSTEGVRSRFHVLRAPTRLLRYRGRQVQFSCFALPDSFSEVPRASVPVFMFSAPGLLFGGTEGIRSRFHVLRALTRFLRYRGHRVPFSCFVLPDSFSSVPRASDLVFMFCVPGLVFNDSGGVGSHFHVLRAQTCFRRYGGRRVPFSCFAGPGLVFAVPRASGPIFMFCARRLVFGGTQGICSRFHVLRSWTRFRRYRGRSILFSCFARRDSFNTIPRASGPVFMFCAPGLIFDGTEGVWFRFHVLRARTCFWRYRGRRVAF
jgi:hypothetical protein